MQITENQEIENSRDKWLFQNISIYEEDNSFFPFLYLKLYIERVNLSIVFIMYKL